MNWLHHVFVFVVLNRSKVLTRLLVPLLLKASNLRVQTCRATLTSLRRR